MYTPIAKSDVKPMNHASKLLFVVPVLPAIGTFKGFNFFPVPLLTTLQELRSFGKLFLQK